MLAPAERGTTTISLQAVIGSSRKSGVVYRYDPLALLIVRSLPQSQTLPSHGEQRAMTRQRYYFIFDDPDNLEQVEVEKRVNG